MSRSSTLFGRMPPAVQHALGGDGGGLVELNVTATAAALLPAGATAAAAAVAQTPTVASAASARAMIPWLELRRACVEVLESTGAQQLAYTALEKLTSHVALHDICGKSASVGKAAAERCASLALDRLSLPPLSKGSSGELVVDSVVLLRADRIMASKSAFGGSARCVDTAAAADAAGMERLHRPLACTWELRA